MPYFQSSSDFFSLRLKIRLIALFRKALHLYSSLGVKDQIFTPK